MATQRKRGCRAYRYLAPIFQGKNHLQVGKSTLLLASFYERHGESVSPKGNKDNFELELYVDALEPLKATLGHV